MLPSVLFSLISFATASPSFGRGLSLARDSTSKDSSSSLKVDLGYSVYQGYYNDTSKLNIFKGVRFAKAPTGKLRWQPPRSPATSRSKTINAQQYSVQCPQNDNGNGTTFHAANETDVSEDCLFLNVWTPSSGEKNLPVMVWVHGGGYGMGNGRYDFSDMINTNNNSFVGVAIQYRLGAFGFLSSDEVHLKGVPNAGLLDQQFALEWVQKYIHLFNGDKSKVTLAGESAGAGSVMLHAMAYGGTQGTKLFRNAFGASPYTYLQYGYKDWIPSQAYYAFANAAGCDAKDPYFHTGSLPIFECLQGKDSKILINASMTVSQAGLYGTWAFLPVTDGKLVQQLPSIQLTSGKVNGVNGLFGNNANEGLIFVPPIISTEEGLLEYLKIAFPLFSDANLQDLLELYPSTDAPDNPEAPLFATNGMCGPTAINQSSVATGQLQRASLIYGESTLVCPSYWLAEAYSRKRNTSCDEVEGGHAYKYQFSVPPSLHAIDVPAYFPQNRGVAPPAPHDLSIAFQTLIGNFVVHSNPSVNSLVANGVSTGNQTTNPTSAWPAYSLEKPIQMDLNTTCPLDVPTLFGFKFCVGGENRFSLVNAATWEGGRAKRCGFWKNMGSKVPE